MRNSFSCLLFIGVSVASISCTNKELNKELEVINDAFLKVVGTVAYHELSLRPPAPDPGNKDTLTKPIPDNLAIIVSDTLFPIKNWADNLVWLCKGFFLDESDPLTELQKPLCNMEDTGEGLRFETSKIGNIGRYTLITERNKSKDNYIVVGKVQFSRVALNENGTLAGFVAVISVSERAGIEKLFVLSKVKEKWEVVKTEILSIW
jgi:hypothetical protein